MSWSAYSRLKDSSIEWLGHIPSSWDVRSLRHLGEAIIGLTYAPEDVVDSGPDATLVLRASNIQGGSLHFDDVVYVSSVIPPHLRIRRGDLLICSRSGSRDLIGKNVYITGDVVGQTFGAFMTVFRSEFNRYLYWVFNSRLFDYQTATFLTSTINQLTAGNLKGMKVPFPKSSEQRAICEFLEAETAKIDAVIAKQQQLIATLREDRAATITHAITFGLDPKAKLKETGIEWFDKVPSHWTIRPLAAVTQLIQTGPFGSQLHTTDYVEDGVPIINPSHIVDRDIRPSQNQTVGPEKAAELARHWVQRDDVIAARRGELGRCAVVGSDAIGHLCGTGSLLIRLRDAECDADYFQRFFSSYANTERLLQVSEGSTMDNLSAGIVARLRVCLPPIEEQRAIAVFLNRRCGRIDSLIDTAKGTIATLREYRSALITDAVTGKIDVRGAA